MGLWAAETSLAMPTHRPSTYRGRRTPCTSASDWMVRHFATSSICLRRVDEPGDALNGATPVGDVDIGLDDDEAGPPARDAASE